MKRLTICIPTYRRNEPLATLLSALMQQRIEHDDAPDVDILVIDNNPGGDAQSVVNAANQQGGPYRVRYFHEERPGVVHVRNSAIEQNADRDAIACIDDDELPADGWLQALWEVWHETGATVVWGNVKARYADSAPRWVVAGDFHSIPVLEEGRGHAVSGNCLILLEPVRTLGLRFDPALATIGGEDTVFFDALLEAGELIYGTRRAVTYEIVPESRANLDWLRQRWRRTGLTDAIMISRRKKGWSKGQALFQGVARVVIGGAALAATWVLRGGRLTPAVASRFFTFERGLGMISFARGRIIEEYARPSGS